MKLKYNWWRPNYEFFTKSEKYCGIKKLLYRFPDFTVITLFFSFFERKNWNHGFFVFHVCRLFTTRWTEWENRTISKNYFIQRLEKSLISQNQILSIIIFYRRSGFVFNTMPKKIDQFEKVCQKYFLWMKFFIIHRIGIFCNIFSFFSRILNFIKNKYGKKEIFFFT